jgi:dihydropteroate synthase
VLDRAVEERLVGTVVANTVALCHGADIVRVHDYREALDMVRLFEAIRC